MFEFFGTAMDFQSAENCLSFELEKRCQAKKRKKVSDQQISSFCFCNYDDFQSKVGPVLRTSNFADLNWKLIFGLGRDAHCPSKLLFQVGNKRKTKQIKIIKLQKVASPSLIPTLLKAVIAQRYLDKYKTGLCTYLVYLIFSCLTTYSI